MAKSFGTLPATAQAIKPFTVSVPEEELDAFKTLLRHSKVATPTYESLQEDRRYGVTSAWMVNAKDHWLNKFDW
jgi:microsomal epoxide hydrolase